MKYRGIKASELISEIKKHIDKYGDLYVYKEINGNVRPINFITYYPKSEYFELT